MASNNQYQSGKKVDTYSYKGWLNSDSFLKRAFAIYGYMLVAGIIIMVPIYILFFILMILIVGIAGVSSF